MANVPDLPPLPPDSVPAGAVPVTPASPPTRPARGNGLLRLGRLLLGLLLLGVGVSGGWLVGMLAAQVLPSRNPEPPATEVALRYGGQTLNKLRQLPRWWQGSDRPVSTPVPVPALGPDDTIDGAIATDAPPPLAEADRDRLQSDLSDLQADLASLNARLQTLETTLESPAMGGLEDRLQRLDQRLAAAAPASEAEAPAPEAADSEAPASETAAPEAADPETPTPEPSTPEAAAPATPVPYREPRFSRVSDRVVLPSALLFEPGSSILTALGQQLLDSVVPDLHRAGAATLVVGSHTDNTLAPEQAAALSLQQAVAVQRHLAPQMEGSSSRWVTVGYGQARPRAVGTSEADRQRNQRVEIGIVPGR